MQPDNTSDTDTVIVSTPERESNPDSQLVPSTTDNTPDPILIPSVIPSDILEELLTTAKPTVGFAGLLAAVNTLNMLLLKWSEKDDALASMYLVLADLYFVMSFSKGTLKALPISVRPLLAAGKDELAGEKVRIGFLVSTGLSVLISGAFLTVEPLSNFLGVNHDLTDAEGQYFSVFAVATPPILWLTLAQYTVFSLKDKSTFFTIGASFALSGVPLEIGLLMGTPISGTLGLAISALFAATVTAAGSAFYLMNKRNSTFKQYNLFKCQLNDVRSQLWDFLKIGVPLGITGMSEHVSPLVISLFTGHWKEAALASQVFSRANSFVDAAVMALSMATMTLVSEEVGRHQKAVDENNSNLVKIAVTRKKNIICYSLILGCAGTSLAAAVYFTFSNQLTNIFIDFSEYQSSSDGLYESDGLDMIDEDVTVDLAQKMLYVNGIGIVLRGQLHLLMGALAGFKDVVIPPLVSFLCVSGPVLIDYLLTMPWHHTEQQQNEDPIQLFNIRNLGYLPAIGFMAYRVYQTIQEKEQAVEVAAQSAAEVDSENSADMAIIVDGDGQEGDSVTTGDAASITKFGVNAPGEEEPVNGDGMGLLQEDEEPRDIEAAASSWRCGGMPCTIL